MEQDLSPHQNQSLDTWIKFFGLVKLQESQTLVCPRARKTLNTKTATFWYILYILRLDKDQALKIVGAEDQILKNTVCKMQPHIHYIPGDMISQSQGSSLFQKSSINKTPGENCNILGYRGKNGITEDVI